VSWFKKKPNESERLADIVDEVEVVAMLRFGAHGLPVTVLEGTAGVNTVLVSASGSQYPLNNLILRSFAAPPNEVMELVTGHVDALVAAEAAPDVETLSDAQLLDLTRVRLMPADAAAAIGANYARRVTDDFAVMLCVDYPSHLSYLSDEALGGKDPDELAAAGLAAVMAEPVQSVEQIEPGIWLLQGESPYTATKVLGFEHLVGFVLPAAPHGVVFGVPHRHAIVAHVVRDLDAVKAVSSLAALIAANATDNAPGGALSTSLYYWHEGMIDVVGAIGESGTMQVDGSGRFGTVLQGLPVQP
jgi:hypothetical protein